jgi:hypothetical protein
MTMLVCSLLDMPQAQALAGCKSQSAREPCRMCHVKQGDELGDQTFDAKAVARTMWETEIDRAEVANGARGVLQDRGLASTPSPLESSGLIFDVTQQIPPEPMHALLIGIGLLCVSLLVKSLTPKWSNSLGAILSLMSKSIWLEKFPPLKLSKREILKMNAEQVSRTIQLLPFALTWPAGDRIGDWLESNMFTVAAREGFEERVHGNFVVAIRNAFTLLAAANVIVFCDERVRDASYLEELQEAIDTALDSMKIIFGEVLNRPNTHTLSAHLADAAGMFAIPKNFDVRTLEAKHGPFRRFISRSSHLAVERQMLMWANIQQAVQFVAAGGVNPSCSAGSMIPDNILSCLRSDAIFAQLLDRSPHTDPHGVGVGNILRDGINWGKDYPGEVILSEEECWMCEADPDDVLVREVSYVEFEDVSSATARICKNQFWLIEVRDSKLAPAGPRAGHGVAEVCQVLCIDAIPFVRVRWYGKTGSVQYSTQCYAYVEKQNKRFQTLIPTYSLSQRIHMVQHGPLLLLNKYFIK